MKKISVCLILISIISANPIMTQVVNEFRVDPYDSERVEFRGFITAGGDTGFTTTALLNTKLVSRWNTMIDSAFIDTDIYLPNSGYAVITHGMLRGNFWLPNDMGFIKAYHPNWTFRDSIFYPGHASNNPIMAPTPPAFCSAAKYHCWLYDSTFPICRWNLVMDWYIDSTPTFGGINDGYPGCLIAGHVYDSNNQPLYNAQVTANIKIWSGYAYVNYAPFYLVCTTYTSIDGSYRIDSLLPQQYYVNASAAGYQPATRLTNSLCNTNPPLNFDFNLLIGIEENTATHDIKAVKLYPLPVIDWLILELPNPQQSINIYDISGKLCLSRQILKPANLFKVDCHLLPSGIYFIPINDKSYKFTKL